MSLLGMNQVLADAPRHLAAFRERTGGISKEEKGIRPSELFFLYAAVADLAPARLVESGRARAQSTLVLSLLFPDAEIISVESDRHSPDVAVATERLKKQRNVECRFGDSRVLLPALVRTGDVVLIDGPKDFRALKLALSLLRTKNPLAVFVHDLWLGSRARAFVDRHLPRAFTSDAPAWLRSYARLDGNAQKAPDLSDRPVVYGATLVCFPAQAENYLVRLLQCSCAQGWERLLVNLGRIHGEGPRPPDFSPLA